MLKLIKSGATLFEHPYYTWQDTLSNVVDLTTNVSKTGVVRSTIKKPTICVGGTVYNLNEYMVVFEYLTQAQCDTLLLVTLTDLTVQREDVVLLYNAEIINQFEFVEQRADLFSTTLILRGRSNNA